MSEFPWYVSKLFAVKEFLAAPIGRRRAINTMSGVSGVDIKTPSQFDIARFILITVRTNSKQTGVIAHKSETMK